MADPQLINYINASLANNIPIEQIKQNLLGAGWNPQQVDEAINFVSSQTKPKGKFPVWIIISVVAVIFIGAGVFFFMNYSSFFQTNSSVNNPSITQGSETPSTNNTVNETSQSVPSNMQLISCGTDIDCFINQSNTCISSSLTYPTTLDLLGFVENETVYYEIRGLSSNNCILYTKILNVYGKYSQEQRQIFLNQNMTDEQINQYEQQINSALSSTVGEDGTCYYPLSYLIQKINGIKTGTFDASTENLVTYNCTGSLYNRESVSYNVTVSGGNTTVTSSTSNSTATLAP